MSPPDTTAPQPEPVTNNETTNLQSVVAAAAVDVDNAITGSEDLPSTRSPSSRHASTPAITHVTKSEERTSETSHENTDSAPVMDAEKDFIFGSATERATVPETEEQLALVSPAHIPQDSQSATQDAETPGIGLDAKEKDHGINKLRASMARLQTAPTISSRSEEPWNEKDTYAAEVEVNGDENGENLEAEFASKRPEESNNDSRPEIQSIMEQFKDESPTDTSDRLTSPSGTNLPVFQYPPRTSSLEHQNLPPSSVRETMQETAASSTITQTPTHPELKKSARSNSAPSVSGSVVAQPPLPEPDPEPDLPFDFHRFLEQLRHRTADPVAKFLRSFLMEFGKKPWMVHEQVKIISDFLSFIGNRMAQCDVWRTVSDAEFDNAREGMEKLVMNRLYTQTFSPEIPLAEPSKSRRKGASQQIGPGRRGQHQEDVERDEVLAQKVRIYGWIEEKHLDIKPFGTKGKKFLVLAQKELSKIKSYRAPRDKVICVLNCCKVLFGYLRNADSDQSADDFIPLLIYTVIKANPDHLVSSVQYILRFRNQDKLSGEAGYYMSSLMGAVQFIENLDRTSLTVSDEEFEKNVEMAVSEIAERHSAEEKRINNAITSGGFSFAEKSTLSRAQVTPRNSTDAERANPRRLPSSGDNGGNTSSNDDENDAVAGLLRTISKPLSSIGRMFSDESSTRERGRPVLTPHTSSTPRIASSPAPAPALAPTISNSQPPQDDQSQPPQAQIPHNFPPGAAATAALEESRKRAVAEDTAARRASAETAEAHRRQRAEHETVVETLSGMFPDLDKDIISDVVRMKEGRVGLAVDACLALSR